MLTVVIVELLQLLKVEAKFAYFVLRFVLFYYMYNDKFNRDKLLYILLQNVLPAGMAW